MPVLPSLRPVELLRIMDLVEAAGHDITDWANTKGAPAANPKYCYEWAFLQAGQPVVLCLWHEEMQEENDVVSEATRGVQGGGSLYPNCT